MPCQIHSTNFNKKIGKKYLIREYFNKRITGKKALLYSEYDIKAKRKNERHNQVRSINNVTSFQTWYKNGPAIFFMKMARVR